MERPASLTPITPPLVGATHALPEGEIIARLGTDPDDGLAKPEVEKRQALYGRNDLTEAPPPPGWRKLLAQVTEPVVLVLLAAATLSAGIGAWADALAILAIVALNALLGLYQEERAEHALAALRKLSAPVARVIRDGRPQAVPAGELVPGDLVEVAAGDFVPANVRLLAATSLRGQEAALTGESEPVDKDPRATLEPAAPLGDRRNMAYLGTVVAAGKATALVTATGMQTEIGRIAGMLQYQAPRRPPCSSAWANWAGPSPSGASSSPRSYSPSNSRAARGSRKSSSWPSASPWPPCRRDSRQS